MSEFPNIPDKIIRVRDIVTVGVRENKVLLECEVGDNNFQEVEFNWLDLKSVYEYLTEGSK